MKKIGVFIITILFLVPELYADIPKPGDFGFGLPVESGPGGAFYELKLSEAVYERITREDFGDIRIFNSDKELVPHILIHEEEKKITSRPPVDLPVFPIVETRGKGSTARICARVTRDGALVEIEGQEKMPHTVITGYVIDASSLEVSPDRLKLTITEENQDYMFSVRVDTSDDLTNWSLLKMDLGVANLSFKKKILSKTVVKIGRCIGKYLKISWPSTANGSKLVGVRALFPEGLADENRQIRMLDSGQWDQSDDGSVLFQSPGLFPVDRVNLIFPHENSMVVAGVHCGNHGKKDGRRFFSDALFYRLEAGKTRLMNDPMEIPVSPCRSWSVFLDGHGVGAGNDLPKLQLGAPTDSYSRPGERLHFSWHSPVYAWQTPGMKCACSWNPCSI